MNQRVKLALPLLMIHPIILVKSATWHTLKKRITKSKIDPPLKRCITYLQRRFKYIQRTYLP